MKTFAKSACLVLLTAWAGTSLSLAQTIPPAGTNQPPASANKTTQRFSGKIESLDAKAKTITLQGTSKIEIGITDKTKIIKAKKPRTFDVLAVGQAVTGRYRKDSTGALQADTLNVGDPRQPLAEPIPKTFVAPDK